MAQEFRHRVTISGPEPTRLVDLQTGTNTIGRQAGNDIRLDHPRVSRRHAELRCTAEVCQIVDVGSANGTFVNGERLIPEAPLTLNPGDKVTIAPFQLEYERQVIVQPEPEVVPPPLDAVGEGASPAAAVAPLTIEPPPPGPEPDYTQLPPGLSRTESRYLQYLPGVYETDFMKRFLALFESILTPIEWNANNFDMYLSPGTAPEGFLPWLAYWFQLTFDESWSEEQRRALLCEAHHIYATLGTKQALSRLLEIYTGHTPEIDDEADDLEPFTFTVNIPLRAGEVNRPLLEQLIDASKPAHTSYKLRFRK